MRTHPFNAQASSILTRIAPGKNGKVVRPTSTPSFVLLCKLTYYSWGKGSSPAPISFQELMHQEGWKDLKEILISTLAGKSKRAFQSASNSEASCDVWDGRRSSNLARESPSREPKSSIPEEIKAFPSPSPRDKSLAAAAPPAASLA